MLYMYFFPVLILLFTLVPKAGAGISGPIAKTDSGADRLVYYFDTRGRQSYVQLANLSNSIVAVVNVQIWHANSSIGDCEELNFNDTYTPNDLHTYDMSNIVTNTAIPIGNLPSGAYGFVVVSLSTGPADSLVGATRIIDDAGYEYRANASAPESASPPTDGSLFGNINFNNTNGYSFSELIGFTYAEISPDTVYASPGVSSVFGGISNPILIFDEDENILSCSPQLFACSDGNSNIAIDNSLPNSKGNPNRVCNTSIISATNNSGHLFLPFESFVCTDPLIGGTCPSNIHFVGFIGLNNGAGSGSFDSWWEGGETP